MKNFTITDKRLYNKILNNYAEEINQFRFQMQTIKFKEF